MVPNYTVWNLWCFSYHQHHCECKLFVVGHAFSSTLIESTPLYGLRFIRDRMMKPPTQQVVKDDQWVPNSGGRHSGDGAPTHSHFLPGFSSPAAGFWAEVRTNRVQSLKSHGYTPGSCKIWQALLALWCSIAASRSHSQEEAGQLQQTLTRQQSRWCWVEQGPETFDSYLLFH